MQQCTADSETSGDAAILTELRAACTEIIANGSDTKAAREEESATATAITPK